MKSQMPDLESRFSHTLLLSSHLVNCRTVVSNKHHVVTWCKGANLFQQALTLVTPGLHDDDNTNIFPDVCFSIGLPW